MSNKGWWEGRRPTPNQKVTGLPSSNELQEARGVYDSLAQRLDAIVALIPDPVIDMEYIGDVSGTYTQMEMIGTNTHPTTGGSLLYTIRITTDTQAVDTGAGISVVNIGQSDNIYLGVAGKSSGTTTPTGIGIDLNKEPATGDENNAGNFRGYGIQIYDWSTTDGGVDSATGIYLWKKENLNTAHVLLEMVANKNMVRGIVDPSVGGYDAQAPVIALLRGDTGATRWQLTAGGDLVFIEDGTGVRFVTNSGNESKVNADKVNNRINWRMPLGGIRFVNNAFTTSRVEITDDGQLSVRNPGAAIPFLVEGTAMVYNLTLDNGLADGGNLNLLSNGFTTFTLDNNSGTFRIVQGVTSRAWISPTGVFEVPGTVVLGNTTIGGTFGVTGLTSLVNATLSGTLGVTGISTLGSGTFSGTLGVTGLTSLVNATLSGTLGVTGLTSLGNATLSGTLGVTGLAGFTSATFSSNIGVSGLSALTNVTVSGTLGVTGTSTLGNTGITSLTVTGSVSLDNGLADGANLSLLSNGFSAFTFDNNSGAFRIIQGVTQRVGITSGGVFDVPGTSTFGSGTFSGTLGVTGTSTLGNTSISSLTATGSISLSNGLADGADLNFLSQGNTTFFIDNNSGAFRIVQGATLRVSVTSLGVFNVPGNSTFGGTVQVTGTLSPGGNVDTTTDYRIFRGGGYVAGGIEVLFSAAVNVWSTLSRAAGTTAIDVTSYSVPAGCKGVILRAYSKLTSGTISDANILYFRKQGGSDTAFDVRPQIINIYAGAQGVVPINTANNQVDFVVAGVTQTCGVQIIGYIA
jgi:hypothetical protein